jgi:tripartite-type tricarboxylate transporter receptor subunit TctC
MKKLLLILLLLSNNVFAQKQNVVVSFATGTPPDVICRHVMEKYDNLYNTTSTILNVPGAEQVVGFNSFINMSEFGMFCAGNGILLASKTNPNLNINTDLIKPVAMLYTYSYFIYASRGNSLDELMKESKNTGKKLLVGAISNHSAKIVTMILDDNKVEYDVVTYKKPSDSLPSLRDKQLDIYVDGGTLKPILDDMKDVKEIAHFATKNVSKSENLYNRNINVQNIQSRTIIYVNSNVSDNEIYELNRRFNDIMKRQDTIDFIKSRYPSYTIYHSTVKEIDQYMKKFKYYINYVYN